MKDDRILVLGNGPSLRDVDIPAVRTATMGMNAAYRAWDRWDWAPDYYLCLDHRLILSHVDYIAASAASGRFRGMFLAASILDVAPEIKHAPTVIFIDQYLDYWWKQFGAPHDLPRMQEPFFDAEDKNLLTTGGFAVRWSAALGYRDIGLIGIDCRYEALAEWKTIDASEIGLEMAETPAANPNYFFDDYQRRGDLFNVPSPASHGFNLHLEAVRQADFDVRAIDPAARIVNCAATSELNVQAAMPYRPLPDFLGDPVRIERRDPVATLPDPAATLDRRGDPMRPIDQPRREDQVGEVILIDPDTIDAIGADLAFAKLIGRATGDRGVDFSIIGHRNFDNAQYLPGLACDAVLHAHSWTIGNRPNGPAATDVEGFEDDLRHVLTLRRERGTPERAALYLRAGSFDHARVIANLLDEFEGYSATVNLFYTPVVPYTDPDYVDRWLPFLNTHNPRLALTAPTDQCRLRLIDAYGVDLPIAPHPSTTFDDIGAGAIEPLQRVDVKSHFTVLFPAAMRIEKGYATAVEVATALHGESRYRCIVRSLVRPGTPKPLLDAHARLMAAGVEVPGEDLSDAEFVALMAGGDMIVLPYQAPDFAERTSGLLIDALLLGKPVVVIEGTWLADVTTEYGIGVVVRDDTDALVAGVQEVAHRYPELVAACARARVPYLAANSWEALASSVIDHRYGDPVRPIIRPKPSHRFIMKAQHTAGAVQSFRISAIAGRDDYVTLNTVNDAKILVAFRADAGVLAVNHEIDGVYGPQYEHYAVDFPRRKPFEMILRVEGGALRIDVNGGPAHVYVLPNAVFDAIRYVEGCGDTIQVS